MSILGLCPEIDNRFSKFYNKNHMNYEMKNSERKRYTYIHINICICICIYLKNGRFKGEAIGEGFELESTTSDANGEFLVKELSGEEEIARSGFGAEFRHVPQADPCLLHTTPFLDLLYQSPRERLTRLLLRRHG